MILCDTGPLVALIDQDDPSHTRCVAALRTLPAVPLPTTWPCWVEAMYLLWRAGGFPAQEELWAYLADGLVTLYTPVQGDWERMRLLMRQYRDIPMDLADASLVVAAERRNLHRIFTLDSDFHAYRIEGKQPFEIVPEPGRSGTTVPVSHSQERHPCRATLRIGPISKTETFLKTRSIKSHIVTDMILLY